MRLCLSDADAAVIRKAAAAAYPEECCGLLVGARTGDGVVVTRVVPAPNIAPKPAHDRFELDPAVHLKIQREARAAGQEVVGHYHSHPDGHAEPSAVDRASVYDHDLVWLIAAVDGRGRTDIAAFVPEGEGFRRLSVRS